MGTENLTRKSVACPKCAGTGIVSRFLDYKSGVCFDCGGTGRITAVPSVKGRKAIIDITPELAEVGTKVQRKVRGDVEVETITKSEVKELGWVLVTTDKGNEYWVEPGRQSPLMLVELPVVEDTDEWGRKLMQAGDGHSAWSCNNRKCADHPDSLYGR